MLRITVEIVPFGNENAAREIGKGYVINDGTGTNNISNYNCIFKEIDNNKENKIKVKGFNRKKGFWPLVGEALKKMQKQTDRR